MTKMLKILFVSLFMIGCKNSLNPNGQDGIINDESQNDSVTKTVVVTTKIKDTLIVGEKVFGDVFVVRKLEDSIKRSEGDLRGVEICLNIYTTDKNIYEINEKNCDTFYQANLDFEDVRVPFFITPNKVGKMSIKGKIKEEIILKAYQFEDSTETRYVEYEGYFRKDVYVKGVDMSSKKM